MAARYLRHLSMIVMAAFVVVCGSAHGQQQKQFDHALSIKSRPYPVPTGAGTVISLSPTMLALDPIPVPGLNETIPDADITKPGAELTPSQVCGWVFAPGEPITFVLKHSNPEIADRLQLTVWDWQNRPLVTRKFREDIDYPITFKVSGRGTYLLTLDGFKVDKCVFRMARSFCVAPDNERLIKTWAYDQFFIGTCSFPARQGWMNTYSTASAPGLTNHQSADLDAQRTARMGLQVVRVDAGSKIGVGGHGWLDWETTDPGIASLTKRGIRVDLQLWGPPPVLKRYESVTEPLWRYPRAEAPYKAYVEEAVSRYAKDASFIEIGNEPDNLDFWRGTPEEYVTQHRWASDVLRKLAPKTPIANGGYCLIKPEWTPVIARGIKGSTNLIAYHSHGDLSALKAAFKTISNLHKEAGYDRPTFVNTEMGWAAWRLDQERNQAVTGLQKALYCWAHGHRGALLYSSRDVGGPRMKTGSEVDWGYTDYFFCPRFAYGAMSGLVSTLAGYRFAGIVEENDNLHVYAFKANGKTVICAFQEKGEQKLATEVSTSANTYSVIDPMGNVIGLSQLSKGSHRIEMNIGEYPSFYRFEGEVKVRYVQEAVMPNKTPSK